MNQTVIPQTFSTSYGDDEQTGSFFVAREKNFKIRFVLSGPLGLRPESSYVGRHSQFLTVILVGLYAMASLNSELVAAALCSAVATTVLVGAHVSQMTEQIQ